MTDEKIIEALVDMASGENLKCAFRYCNVAHEILDLINRQKTEIDILIRKKDRLEDEIAEQKAEIERLASKCEDCAGCSAWECDCSNVRAYAIEEFAERLKEKAWQGMWEIIAHVDVDDIDSLVKELTEKGR